MRADDKLCGAAFHARKRIGSLEPLLAANEQFDLIASYLRWPIAVKYPPRRKIVLNGENFRWRH